MKENNNDLTIKSEILTNNGYNALENLVDKTVDIITTNGVMPAQIFNLGVKDIYKLYYASSKYSSIKKFILVTKDDKIYSDGKIFKPQDIILKKIGQSHLQINKKSFLTGWAWNDGHYTKVNDSQTIYFTPNKDDDAKKIFFDVYGEKKTQSPIRLDAFSCSRKFIRYMELFGNGFKKNNTYSGEPIFFDTESKISWLSGFLSANSSVQRSCIRLKITSFELIKTIKDALNDIGISSCKIYKVKVPDMHIRNTIVKCQDAYTIEISANDACRFKHLIGLAQSYKNERIKEMFFYKLEYFKSDTVYGFSVLTDNDYENNAYINGILVHSNI